MRTESNAIDPTTVSDIPAGGYGSRAGPAPRRRIWANKVTTVKAIQIEEFGGPEVLRFRDLPDPEPGEGEVLIDIARAGINFADTHATRNDYLAEQTLPMIPGGEVSGRTPDGRRVAALLGGGAYAQKVTAPEALARAGARRGR